MVLHNKIYSDLANRVHVAVKEINPDSELSVEEIYGLIGEAPNIKMGHFAFPCFPLAKALRTSPVNISKSLAEKITSDELIEKCEAQGPYLNFTITNGEYGERVVGPILSGKYFTETLIPSKERVMFEYSQPNTHKELHVGHMRNLCLGNALIRMHQYIGHNVIAATYPGDVGTHVAKCLWYLKFHNQDELPTNSEERGPWLGNLYSKASNKLTDELGTDKEDQNRKELTQILKELESGKGEYFDLWKETREWSIDLMKKVYNWVDVDFDRWFFESEVDSASLDRAKKLYEEGKFIESDGAIGMDLSEDKLGFCMMIKSDGNGMYATKDIDLAYKKFEEYNLDKSIYVVDKRQAHHFRQVFCTLKNLGFEHHKDCFHLQYDFVELPDGAMSSRKGNIIPLTDLIVEMEATIKENYLERYRGDWTDEEIEETAKMVANGAIKYGMVRMDNSRKIVFDMKEWLKLDGETGPYLQYVHARINSLCEKLGYIPTADFDWSLLTKPQEVALLLKLTSFNGVMVQAVEQYKTANVCSYLYELGKLFNSFYAECPIGKAENEKLKEARLALAKAVGLVMEQGLATLGIKAPKKM